MVTNPPYYRSKGTVAFLEARLRVARRSVSVQAPVPFLASQGRNPWFRGLLISHVLIDPIPTPEHAPGGVAGSGCGHASRRQGGLRLDRRQPRPSGTASVRLDHGRRAVAGWGWPMTPGVDRAGGPFSARRIWLRKGRQRRLQSRHQA